jgi:Mrp family chromosome partitioning ATPase
VTIVDADLRRATLTRSLGIDGGPGLTAILAGTADVDVTVHCHGLGAVSVIPAGQPSDHPKELLASSRMKSLIERLRQENDFVLLDAPSLLPAADASALAGFVDGVLVTVRYGRTRGDQLQRAVALARTAGGTVVGVVLNVVPLGTGTARSYAHGHGYSRPTAQVDA